MYRHAARFALACFSVALCAVAVLAAPATSASPPDMCGLEDQFSSTKFTSSTTHHTTTTHHEAPPVTVETYLTRVTGEHDGTTVYDETVADEPSSQAVQDAQEAARDAIVAAGGNLGSITGPTLIDSDRTLEDSSTSVTTEVEQVQTITVEQYIGPTTYQSGEDKSLTCNLLAGNVSYNDNTHTETFEEVTSTTTNTYLNTALYELSSGAAGTPTPTQSPTASSTPTPTPGSATPTPTPTGGAQPNIWQDLDCDREVTTRDNQTLLRFVLQQPPLSQTQPCPTVGATVTIDTFGPHPWGDGDCDTENTTRDNQATLRFVLDQPPLSKTQPCPDIGSPVTIITPG